MAHAGNRSLVTSPQVVVDVIRDAHEYYVQNRIDERYEYVALDIVRRYVAHEGLPRESDSLFAAALYIVTRHPWSHPNPLTKTEFAAKLRIKESSIEWYVDSIVEKLGFLLLRDRTQLPFYVDPEGTISSVITSVVRASVREEIVRSVVRGTVLSPDALAERIVDRLCNVVKIVPGAFLHDLYSIVQQRIELESQCILEELDHP